MSAFGRAWETVADAADMTEGTALLDVGCGEGGFCAFAAARGVSIHGLDVESEAIARATAAVPAGDFRLGFMESLPWSDGRFALVTGFNAFQYALDPDLALAEAARVTSPGGRLAVCKWGPPAENEFFSFLIALGAAGINAPDLPMRDPVEAALQRAGFEMLASGGVSAPIELGDEGAIEAALERAGALPDIAAGCDPIAEAAPYRQPDGRYRFENGLRYWIMRP